MKAEDTMYIGPVPVTLEVAPVLQEEAVQVEDEGTPNIAQMQEFTPPSSPLSALLETFVTTYGDNIATDKKGKMPLRRVCNAVNLTHCDANCVLQISTQNLDAGPPTPASSSQDSPQTSSGKRRYYRPHVSKYPRTASPGPDNTNFPQSCSQKAG